MHSRLLERERERERERESKLEIEIISLFTWDCYVVDSDGRHGTESSVLLRNLEY